MPRASEIRVQSEREEGRDPRRGQAPSLGRSSTPIPWEEPRTRRVRATRGHEEKQRTEDRKSGLSITRTVGTPLNITVSIILDFRRSSRGIEGSTSPIPMRWSIRESQRISTPAAALRVPPIPKTLPPNPLERSVRTTAEAYPSPESSPQLMKSPPAAISAVKNEDLRKAASNRPISRRPLCPTSPHAP